MEELLVDDRRAARTSPQGQRTSGVSSADVSHFVRDPHGFVASIGVSSAEAFVNLYLKGIERRLDEVMGPPSAVRLATLSPQTRPCDCRPDHRENSPHGGMPRMGAIVVAAAAVAAVTAIATGTVTCYMLFTSKPTC